MHGRGKVRTGPACLKLAFWWLTAEITQGSYHHEWKLIMQRQFLGAKTLKQASNLGL